MGVGRIDVPERDLSARHTDDPTDGATNWPRALGMSPRGASLPHDGPWLAPEAFSELSPIARAGHRTVRASSPQGWRATSTARAQSSAGVYTSNGAERPARATPLDPVGDVYPRIARLLPSLSTAGRTLLAAQFAHETAGGRSCFNFNAGNIKAERRLAEPHMYLARNVEIVSAAELARLTSEKARFRECVRIVSAAAGAHGGTYRVVLDPPHPGSAFRAYASADEGIAAWVHRFERYAAKSQPLADALNRGDALAFAAVLKREFAYFSDDPDRYGRGVAAQADIIRRRLPDP